MDAVKSITVDLLGSKKFLATLASVLVWVVGRAGFDVSAEALLPILLALSTFVLAQGWADKGKEAVKTAVKLGVSSSSGSTIPAIADAPTDPS